MAGLGRDLTLGLRMLLRSPGFTAVAVVTLALGIGANTSIFTFINALYLRGMPVERPDRLVAVGPVVSFPVYRDLVDRVDGLSGLTALGEVDVNLDDGRSTARVACELVTPNYFDVLGVPAAIGRTFDAKTDDGAPVLVLGDGAWRRRFGADPAVIGEVVRVNGHPFTVIGVAPRGFTGTRLGAEPALWTPMGAHRAVVPGWDFLDGRQEIWLGAFGRLEAGRTLEQVRARVRTVAGHILELHPDTLPGGSLEVLPLGEASTHLRASLAPVLSVLTGTVGVILLIACANLASLMLVRGAGRRREIGIRLALGASRGRVVRQLLAESLILSALGGAAGLMITIWCNDLAAGYLLRDAQGIDLDLEGRVLGFALLASVFCAVAFGLAPALMTSRLDLMSSLRERLERPASSRLRGALLVAQVSLSVVLVVGSGLFVRNLRLRQAVDPGFQTANLLTFRVSPAGYGPDEGRGLQRRLRERLQALPGVSAVSASQLVQLGGGNIQRPVARIDEDPAGAERLVPYNVIDTGYFRTLGQPLVAGREFDDGDTEGAPLAVIVNETLARQLWPGGPAVGNRVHLPLADPPGPAYEVVGVARDSKYHALVEDPKPYLYLPYGQSYRGAMSVLLRTKGDPRALMDAVRAELRALDPGLPAYRVQTLEGYIGNQLARPRSIAAALSLFGALALCLAGLGLYGLISYSVGQRVREIGIRMVLGASGRDIVHMVVGRGMLLTLTGLALGLTAALLAGRFIEGILFQVSPGDPLSFLAGVVVLSIMAVAASYFPARRAARVEPTRALRCE